MTNPDGEGQSPASEGQQEQGENGLDPYRVREFALGLNQVVDTLLGHANRVGETPHRGPVVQDIRDDLDELDELIDEYRDYLDETEAESRQP